MKYFNLAVAAENVLPCAVGVLHFDPDLGPAARGAGIDREPAFKSAGPIDVRSGDIRAKDSVGSAKHALADSSADGVDWFVPGREAPARDAKARRKSLPIERLIEPQIVGRRERIVEGRSRASLRAKESRQEL